MWRELRARRAAAGSRVFQIELSSAGHRSNGLLRFRCCRDRMMNALSWVRWWSRWPSIRAWEQWLSLQRSVRPSSSEARWWTGTPAAASPDVPAFPTKFVEGVLSGFFPLLFAAELAAAAAEVRDPPTPVKVRLGWKWQGMLLPNKVNLAGEASRPVPGVFDWCQGVWHRVSVFPLCPF